jgi:hypothetical protein
VLKVPTKGLLARRFKVYWTQSCVGSRQLGCVVTFGVEWGKGGMVTKKLFTSCRADKATSTWTGFDPALLVISPETMAGEPFAPGPKKRGIFPVQTSINEWNKRAK